MKVHEALNLYNLHANPEQLQGHEQAGKVATQRVKWVSITGLSQQHNDVPNADHGISTVKECVAKLSDETNVKTVRPFNAAKFWPDVMDDWFVGSCLYHQYEEDFSREDHEAQLQPGLEQFHKLLSSIKPQSYLLAEDDISVHVVVFE